MNRVIKFRAWDNIGNVMVDWNTLKQSAFNDERTNLMYLVITNQTGTFTPMQFTGLHDKNGKEIYEGDITKSTKSGLIYKIVFDRGMFRGEQEPASMSWVHPHSFTDLEIIGNIYKNPDLLK